MTKEANAGASSVGSRRLELELEARGFADVLVVLRPDLRGSPTKAKAAAVGGALKLSASLKKSAGAPAAEQLAAHFVSSLSTPRGMVQAALAPRLAADERAGAATRLLAKSLLNAARAAPATQAPVRYFPNLGAMLGTVTRNGCEALANDERVESVRPAPVLQLIRPTSSKSAVPKDEVTWGIKALEIPQLWAEGLRGEGVKIGQLDTGIDSHHPALAQALGAYAHFDDLGQFQRVDTPYDTDVHGTHTAGILAGRPVNGRHVGVAYQATLVGACVIEGGDVLARVLGGMDWMVGQGVQVLNMSLGLPGWWDEFRDITGILRDRNILPVFAVGNEGQNTSRSPGNYPEALSVGAVDEDGMVASFSSSDQDPSRGNPGVEPVPDVVAPGVNIISCVPDGGYARMSGTSMAAPHIAGLAALLIQHQRGKSGGDYDIRQIESAIFNASVLGPLPTARAGRGIPRGTVALQSL